MFSLLAIPNDVWRSRIATYLLHVDIVRADNAALGCVTRRLFLANIRGYMLSHRLVVRNNNVGVMKWLSLRVLFVRKLELQGVFVPEMFPFPTSFLVHLQDLCFRECRFFPDRQLSQILVACKGTLRTLQFVDSTVSNLCSLRNCEALVSVQFVHCHFITDEELLSSLVGSTVLSDVMVHECNDISGAAVAGLVRDCPELTSVDVKGPPDKPFSVEALAQQCQTHQSNIQKLFVGGCTMISGGAVTLLARGFPQLTALHLNSPNDTITDPEIENLTQSCPHTARISLSRFASLTSDALCSMARNWLALRELNIPGSAICDRGVIAVTDSCLLLQHLNICNCPRVTDTSMQAVCARSKSLRALHVSGCEALTGRAFDTVSLSCPLRNLVAVGTNLAPATTKILQVLGARLQSLSCTGPSEVFVRAAEGHATTRLAHLGVMGSSQLSRRGWMRLSVLFPCLENLVVSHCAQLDDDVLRSFAQHSPRLHTVVASVCENVSAELVQEIPGLWRS